MRKGRLSIDIWLDAGLTALATKGPAALAAEPLARSLGTTKGSFYWHFKDVPDFQTRVIGVWQDSALDQIQSWSNDDGNADIRLRQFGRTLLNDPTEPALRVWAQGDTRVAAVVCDVDAARLTYLADLLRQLGLGNHDFARALAAALVGLPQLAPNATDQQIKTFDTLVDTVLALS